MTTETYTPALDPVKGTLLKKDRPPRVKTHDYTQKAWGHDYTVIKVVNKGQQLEALGWGQGLGVGDFLILQNGTGSSRYQIEKISYKSDPRDMWVATLIFAPREN